MLQGLTAIAQAGSWTPRTSRTCEGGGEGVGGTCGFRCGQGNACRRQRGQRTQQHVWATRAVASVGKATHAGTSVANARSSMCGRRMQ
eukprot:258721-Chlamydomonas_euryale.AAC.1